MLVRFPPITDDSLVVTDIELLGMEGLPGEREFTYSVIMEMDAPVAIDKDSINLKLTVSPGAPTERRQTPNFSGRSFRAQTSIAESAVRTAAVSTQSAAIATTTSEVTTVIPNSSVSRYSAPSVSSIPVSVQSPTHSVSVASQSKSTAPITPSSLSTTPRSLRTSRSSTPTQTRVIQTSSPATPSRRSISSTPSPSRSLASAAQNQVSRQISSAGRSSKEVASARQATRTPPSAATTRETQTYMVSSGRDPASIRGMVSAVRSSISLAPNILQAIYTPPVVEEPEERYVIETEIIELKQKIVIKEERLGTAPRFYVTACLMTSDEIETATSTLVVNHSKHVNEIMTPRLSPTLSASFIRQGQISIGSQQTDPQATKLRLQRRNAPSTSCRDDEGSPWETIFEEDLDINDGEIRYIDRVTTSGYSLMYRAVAVGSNGKSSTLFSTAVVTPPKSQRQVRGRELNSVIKLNALSTEARIGVTDLPEDTVSVSLRKYNLESHDRLNAKRGLSRGFSYVGSTPDSMNKLVDYKTKKVSFSDLELAPGSKYSYVPVAFTKRGKTIIGSATDIEVPADAGDSTQVAATISGLDVTSTDSRGNIIADPSTKFTLEGSLTDFGFEQISAAIGSSAAAGLFGGDISANREKFNALIQFDVIRENQTTGEQESFGLYSPGPFTDSASIRKSKGIKNLKAGTIYVYKATACVRSPDTLFAGLTEPSVDSSTLQRFTKTVAKFRGPMQLRKSTLASTARQSDNTKPSSLEDTNPFLAGRTKDEQSIEVSIPSSSPRVSTIKSSSRRSSNKLTWRVEGENKKIDHFKVYATRNGGRMLVGTIHGDHTSPDFEFTHDLQEPLTRECTYEVVPVDLNFNELSTVQSDPVSPSRSSIISTRAARKSTIRSSTSQSRPPAEIERDELLTAATTSVTVSRSPSKQSSRRSSAVTRSASGGNKR